MMFANKYKVRRFNKNKKWWIRWIRGINWWTYRFWWLFWLIIILVLWLMYLFCPSCHQNNVSPVIQCPECPPCVGQYGYIAPPPKDDLPEMVSAPTQNCGDELRSASGAYEYHVQNYELGNHSGNVVLNFETFTIPDEIIMEYNGQVVFTSGNVATDGWKQAVWSYVYQPNQPTIVTIKVRPSAPDTEWKYNLGCPQ